MYKKDFKKAHSLSKKITSVLAMTTIMTSSYYNQVFAATPVLESLEKPNVGYYAELSKSLVDWNIDYNSPVKVTSNYSLGLGAFYDLNSLGRVRVEIGGFRSLLQVEPWIVVANQSNVSKSISNVDSNLHPLSQISSNFKELLGKGIDDKVKLATKDALTEINDLIKSSTAESTVSSLLKLDNSNESQSAMKKLFPGSSNGTIARFNADEAKYIVGKLKEIGDRTIPANAINSDLQGIKDKIEEKVNNAVKKVISDRMKELESVLASYYVEDFVSPPNLGEGNEFLNNLIEHGIKNSPNYEVIGFTNNNNNISIPNNDSEGKKYKTIYDNIIEQGANPQEKLEKIKSTLDAASTQLIAEFKKSNFLASEDIEKIESFYKNKLPNSTALTLNDARKILDSVAKEAVRLLVEKVDASGKALKNHIKNLRIKNPVFSDGAPREGRSDARGESSEVVESFRMIKNRAIMSVNYDMNVQGIPKLKVHAGLGGGYGYANLESYNINTGDKIKELESYSDIAVMYKAGLTYQISGPISINTELRSVHDFLTRKDSKESKESKSEHLSENQFVVGLRYEF